VVLENFEKNVGMVTMPRITKAILTGGGRATRLRPITTTINKHLIPLANKPMIFHAIEKAVDAGVTEIFINTNPGETQVQEAVGDGSTWGIRITCFEQTGGPQGIAHVVKCAEKYIGTDPFMFYLSDNIVLGSLQPLFQKFETENLDCMLALSQVPDPERFGVPKFSADGVLEDIIEKPKNPPSDFAVTGIYLYNHNFFQAFDHIQKSDRGEYEISSIHSYFLKNGYKVGYSEITGWWKDTGKPNDLLSANRLLFEEQNEDYFTREGACLAGTLCRGKVGIGANTVFGKNVSINGPAIIGSNCYLENCTINPYTTIGSHSIVREATVGNSILFSGCTISAPITIEESIIGKDAVVVAAEKNKTHRLIIGDQTRVEL
jgi:glucose-1-phosphate thymidylyltransferase